MTKEQLKEMALRLQKNNDQLKADIESMKHERENDTEEVLFEFDRFRNEVTELLNVVPREIWMASIRDMQLSNNDLRAYSLHAYDGRIGYWQMSDGEYSYSVYFPGFEPQQSDYEITMTDISSVENMVSLLNNRKAVLNAAMELVEMVLKAYNDGMLHKAQEAVKLTTAYKSAIEPEEDVDE